jgi:GNAT superfamily N-acetyltransferase
MNEPIRIRPARAQDAAILADLSSQLGYSVSAVEIADRVKALSGPTTALLVADNGRVIGWISLQVKISLQSGRFTEITGLVVDERHRGRGVGALLLTRAEDWAREQGCSEVWLRSNVKRSDAHVFYEQRGYTLTKTSFTFSKQLSASVRPASAD